MLYITTRENKDAFTVARVLFQDRASDGGLFVPFRMPEFTQEEIVSLKQKSFGQTVAEILNAFFSCRTSGWDVDLCIGRNPVKLVAMNHRISVAELWHNPEETYVYIVKRLCERILYPQGNYHKPSQWVEIAVRIAVLFGIFGELMRLEVIDGVQPVDMAVAADTLFVPMACWYARRMGLPIGTIICGCNSDNGLWDLIRRGEFNASSSAVHQQDGCLERLIQGTLGCNEVKRYVTCCQNKRTYTVTGESLLQLSAGVFVAVVGKNRTDMIIKSVNKTNAYALNPNTALSYGALQDYRACSSESRIALLLSDCV